MSTTGQSIESISKKKREKTKREMKAPSSASVTLEEREEKKNNLTQYRFRRRFVPSRILR